jgi:hypothetical protein
MIEEPPEFVISSLRPEFVPPPAAAWNDNQKILQQALKES